MSYYPAPDSDIRDKINVLLDLPNYAIKKELKHVTGVDTSDLAAKKDFIALAAEVDKLDNNNLVNVPTGLYALKTTVDDLEAGKLKTIPKILKKLNDLVDKEVVTRAVYNTLNTKVNSLEKKIPDASTLNQVNQCNKTKFREKNWRC